MIEFLLFLIHEIYRDLERRLLYELISFMKMAVSKLVMHHFKLKYQFKENYCVMKEAVKVNAMIICFYFFIIIIFFKLANED